MEGGGDANIVLNNIMEILLDNTIKQILLNFRIFYRSINGIVAV